VSHGGGAYLTHSMPHPTVNSMQPSQSAQVVRFPGIAEAYADRLQAPQEEKQEPLQLTLPYEVLPIEHYFEQVGKAWEIERRTAN